MTLQEFLAAVDADKDMEGRAINEEKGFFVVANKDADESRVYETAIPFGVVEEAQWSDLRGVILGHRAPEVLIKLARIVGYYSRVQNWNASKVGELADRHKGNYRIGEGQ